MESQDNKNGDYQTSKRHLSHLYIGKLITSDLAGLLIEPPSLQAPALNNKFKSMLDICQNVNVNYNN